MKLLNKAVVAAVFALVISSCKKEADVPTVQNNETSELQVQAPKAISPQFKDLKMCTEKYSSDQARAAAITNSKWRNGSVITVRMYGGTSYVRNKVVQYANEWSKYANLTFKFVTSGPANIRVTFMDGKGSYSYIGTDATHVPAYKETMNFGWFNNSTSDEEFSRTTIHEFGHALGLIHEHQHPLASIPWNKPLVYQYYSEVEGWSKDDVDNNLFDRVDPAETQYSKYDPTSIMHYPVQKELTDGVFEVGWNTVLSNTDKAFIAAIYPKQ